MKKSLLIKLSAALALVAGVACERMPVPTGSVTLNFSTGELKTRAGDGVVADGGGIFGGNTLNPDLKIFLVASDSTITAQYPATGTLSSSYSTQASVKFSDIPAGDYEVYAVANTGDSSLPVPDMSGITAQKGLDTLKFSALAALAPPDVNDRIPLSASGTVTVNESNNGQVDLDLLRCVAKVQLSFENLTGATLSLSSCDITIKGINPTTGLVLEPEGKDSVGTARNLALADDVSLDIGKDSTKVVNTLLVFPSLAPGSDGCYYCDVSFTVGGFDKSFTDLPIHDNKSKDITSIGRNQYLKINIRISNKSEISFNFEVSDWDSKTETVEFS